MLLQGDIISTDTAYFLGERLIGMKFAIVNATGASHVGDE
jgi:hypothetical protein